MDAHDTMATGGAPTAIDPVCGMTVEPAAAAGSCEHRGRTWYFCSLGCLKKFQANPEKYLAEKK